MKHKIVEAFVNHFGKQPSILLRAPGRINLIGEHTDYNEGFVLPAAVNKEVIFALSPRTDRTIRFYAIDLAESFETEIFEITKSEVTWANYLLGMIDQFKQANIKLSHGFDLAFGGNVPPGGGMSSSAAITSGMGLALATLFEVPIGRKELAIMAQNTEHLYAGVNCGIMDMYASLFGKKGHLICLDCRSVSHEYLPFETDKYKIVLFNSGVKHQLADSAYNQRRQECETGVKVLNEHFGGINALRDTNIGQLESLKNILSSEVYKRCFYVLQETIRMEKASKALHEGDLKSFGQLMFETHDGLQNDYEVSCKELDFLVDTVRTNPAVIGARMMGGGFGGCTINLVEAAEVENVKKEVSESYFRKFGIDPEVYEVEITNGCELI